MIISEQARPLEMWGGVECTVNRVGDAYFDQIRRSGHHDRITDLDLFADLGLRTLRYPVLWERVAPQLHQLDWQWSDERLARLQELKIEPIVGLLHHGSGPRFTSLIDPDFPRLFADFAHRVAGRYPWVTRYTPINEILTTARFSGLYGLWYPHGRDDRTFAHVLLNQCRATVLAMRRIREVQPGAELMQTEDLSMVHSTPPLAYQADFENLRRWAAIDLLCGKLDENHGLWGYLRYAGVSVKSLFWFLDNPVPPDLIGCDYYITSERFLDHRVENYPELVQGSNQKDRYVDVEAIRVLASGITGVKSLVREAWMRYGIPLAFTEVHLGCDEEEQMRWLHEAWQTANALRREGVPLRAVTPWALLGSYDWNTLLTREANHYEFGAFELSSGKPRPTQLANMIKGLGRDGHYDHPALLSAGWWKRHNRLTYPLFHD